VTETELERLVAQIGEEILARVGGPTPASARKGEGLNLPGEVCPGCVGRCAQTCSRNTRSILAAGADRVTCSERMTRIDPAIAALIDHTILKPEATRDDVVKVCREARQYGFASVCVNPYWVPLVHRELAGSRVLVCSVVGFPLGATFTEVKVAENPAPAAAPASAVIAMVAASPPGAAVMVSVASTVPSAAADRLTLRPWSNPCSFSIARVLPMPPSTRCGPSSS